MTGQWEFVAPPATDVGARRHPPTFSVVIPAYEAAAFIEMAVQSVLGQTTPPLETIVVDDGSTDDLAATLRRVESRVQVLRIDHAGVAAARNAGIAQARGEFVAFLDADDAYQPRFLEALTALAIARPGLQILTTDCTFEVDGQPHGSFYQSNAFPALDQRRVIFDRCFLTTQSAVQRENLEEISGFDESMPLAEDWDLWLRLIVRGARAGLVNEPLATYRLGHRGQATAQRAAALRWRVAVLEKALRSPEITDSERRLIAGSVPGLLRRAALAGVLEVGRSNRHIRQPWLAMGRERRLPPQTRIWGLFGAVTPAVAYRVAQRYEPDLAADDTAQRLQ